MTPSMVELIDRKKRGGRHSDEELGWLCRAFVHGEVPDYQMSAWLMAVRFQGLDPAETLALTEGLVATGETLTWSQDRPVVDKHSTGGVGDKTSIVVVPLLAAAGLAFPKMSGRGLGHTGGTLDKLESIPGFRVGLSLEELQEQVRRIGCAIVGQTSRLVPGDGEIYALRDVTGTVDSTPLIASSIMSKKLAIGARAIILDVKWGSGAILADVEEATALAETMVRIGTGAGRKVRAVLSPMDQPLGRAVGNALEIREAIQTLRGEGPADLHDLAIELGAQLMVLAGATPSLDDARGGLARLIQSGVALRKFRELVEAQGGDPAVVDDPDSLPAAPRTVPVPAPSTGWVTRADARTIADAALALGAGRRAKGDEIDARTGIAVHAKVGDQIEAGAPLAELHSASEPSEIIAGKLILSAFQISDRPGMENAPEYRIIGSNVR